MQTIENEIQQRPSTLRTAGRGFIIRYPSEVATGLGLKGGEQFITYVNHKGEMLIRPMEAVVV